MHWSEQVWVRALRGRRGQPLGLLLLAIFLGVGLAPDLLRPRGDSPGRLRRLSALGTAGSPLGPGRHRRDRRGEPAPARTVAVAADLARPARGPAGRGRTRPRSASIMVMPEADRLSPGRVPEFVPGMGPGLVQRARQACRATTRSWPRRSAAAGRARASPASKRDPWPGRRSRFARRRFAPSAAIPAASCARFEATLRSVEEIDRVARGHGLLNFEAERGVVRRMPLSPPSVTRSCSVVRGRDSPRRHRRRRCSPCGSAPRASRAVGIGGLSRSHRAGRQRAAPLLANRSGALRLGRRRSRRKGRSPCCSSASWS